MHVPTILGVEKLDPFTKQITGLDKPFQMSHLLDTVYLRSPTPSIDWTYIVKLGDALMLPCLVFLTDGRQMSNDVFKLKADIPFTVGKGIVFQQ